MKKALTCTLLSTCVLFGADALVTAPQAGMVRQADRLIPVYGVRGNLIAGQALREGVLAVAASGRWTLVKTENAVSAWDDRGLLAGEHEAGPGPALFGFAQDGATAVAHLPESRETLRWDGTVWTEVPWTGTPDVRVVAAGVGASGETLLGLQRDERTWVVGMAASGARLSEDLLPGNSKLLSILPGGARLRTADRQLVLETSRGVEAAIDLPADVESLSPMGEGWFHLVTAGSNAGLALHLEGKVMGIYYLPEAGP